MGEMKRAIAREEQNRRTQDRSPRRLLPLFPSSRLFVWRVSLTSVHRETIVVHFVVSEIRLRSCCSHDRSRFPARQNASARHLGPITHLEWRKKEDQKTSAFWRFRNGLEQISSPVIWTSLAKIGVQKVNPNWHLVREQSELVCQTLAAEIAEFKPALIVLVTGDFGRHEVVWPLFGGEANGGWRGAGLGHAGDHGGSEFEFNCYPFHVISSLLANILERVSKIGSASSQALTLEVV
jgi:hypothetical protein